jgi:hypothetical protein
VEAIMVLWRGWNWGSARAFQSIKRMDAEKNAVVDEIFLEAEEQGIYAFFKVLGL